MFPCLLVYVCTLSNACFLVGRIFISGTDRVNTPASTFCGVNMAVQGDGIEQHILG
jgi:hypothetical protein